MLMMPIDMHACPMNQSIYDEFLLSSNPIISLSSPSKPIHADRLLTLHRNFLPFAIEPCLALPSKIQLIHTPHPVIHILSAFGNLQRRFQFTRIEQQVNLHASPGHHRPCIIVNPLLPGRTPSIRRALLCPIKTYHVPPYPWNITHLSHYSTRTCMIGCSCRQTLHVVCTEYNLLLCS